MTSVILRQSQELTITIGTTLEASTEIDTRGFGGGSFHLPATAGNVRIAVYARVGNEDFARPSNMDVWDDNSPGEWNLIGIRWAYAGQPYPLPPEVYHYPSVKLLAVEGDAVENVPVFLKA